ncbi:MAG TPA: alpha/beta hydrolase [Candidatus Eisenbacteria bacterium]|nr:alpha/beta hydrolase [Candidatus Eisenbacteria bacterium]
MATVRPAPPLLDPPRHDIRLGAHRPARRWWLIRVTTAIVVGLAVAIAVDLARGGVTATWLRYAGALAYDARGERIEIRPGHAIYLDCRGSGSPTLVLEAGMGSDSATWSPVHDQLAAISRTCSYDRTGRGRSDGGPAGDLAGMSSELSAVLAASGQHPPYVVVGHSLGAVIARVHATLEPEAVAGLVLIDGFDPDIFDGRILPLLGPLRDEYVGHTAGLWDLVASVEGIDVDRSRMQLAKARVEGLPLEVVIAPRADERLDAAANDRIAASVAAGYEELSPGRVTFTIAWRAGHMVQFDRPEYVVEAVRRIVAVVRG